MNKILLTSAGLTTPELKKLFLNLLKKPVSNNKVAFITTAALGENESSEWLENYRKELRDCNIKDIEDLDLKDKTTKHLKRSLNNKDIIYVNGGNTFYLLKYVKDSGFNKILPELINSGKLYIGVSAGSIILGPSIEMAGWEPIPDKNKINLKNLDGLKIVNFSIFPHCKTEDLALIKSYSMQVSYPIVPLKDNQAVLVKNNNFEIIGS